LPSLQLSPPPARTSLSIVRSIKADVGFDTKVNFVSTGESSNDKSCALQA